MIEVRAIGLGAPTSVDVTRPSDGISLVQVAGTSSANAFSLAGGYLTGGTPYQYRLNAYGPGSSNGLAAASQNSSAILAPFGITDFKVYTSRRVGLKSRRKFRHTLQRQTRYSTPVCRIWAAYIVALAKFATIRFMELGNNTRSSHAATVAA